MIWGWRSPHEATCRSIASQSLHSIPVRGRVMSTISSIAPDKLARLIGTPKCPALIDVRLEEDFESDPFLVPGTIRQSHAYVADWAGRYARRTVVVICQKG